MGSELVNTLMTIINFLSLILIAGLAWFLKSMWVDMQKMRNDLTILQTEHSMGKCAFRDFMVQVNSTAGTNHATHP